MIFKHKVSVQLLELKSGGGRKWAMYLLDDIGGRQKARFRGTGDVVDKVVLCDSNNLEEVKNEQD